MVAGHRAQDRPGQLTCPSSSWSPTLPQALHADCSSPSVAEASTGRTRTLVPRPGDSQGSRAGPHVTDHSSGVSTTILELNTLAK